MLSFVQILVLSVVQGACELLPVSSSAHVIAVEKWMHLNPSTPEMVMFLLMLHTGTMFAVIAYFWADWRRHCFASKAQFQWFAMQILLATACTGVVGLILQQILEKGFMHANPKAAPTVRAKHQVIRIQPPQQAAPHPDTDVDGSRSIPVADFQPGSCRRLPGRPALHADIDPH